ncbi:2-amino-4-hydroxy-6-hydroxymethyldihydropteridine diphosphokinase [Hahella sp. CCB-MM4]|uniref:2-amino-4-hydroxy-6- hydroxymethyldihydropteridine diphosphokinase n=1 Tax=Hahella sp. (strain CCB-MM4) TaxID=1926491 RepID=UPI000B9A2947|nr:2-amino-4-hydroxy-6-hydroxymethyldihydropteridine diphosphokinase [Hahella sp. CCB-MM4]OZG70054.1 2-amino-4-hydroxy-6-hydroxymethyldihydropteridine diphosphokinase [Hahella sp. CCB-MM4]
MSVKVPSQSGPLVDCYIGMGSNQNQPELQLNQAVDAIRQHPAMALQTVSSLYQTTPLGGLDQPLYMNAVAHIRTSLSPEALLDVLQAIENQQGRQRNGVRWSSRTLDLDILLYGKEVIRSQRLTIPHYALHERNFVVFPLLELNPECHIPGLGSLQEISETLTREGMTPL